MFGVEGDTVEEEEPELELDEDEGGAGGGEGLDPVERLAQSRAAAGLAQSADGGGGGTGDIASALGEMDEKIQAKTNSVNFYILQGLMDLFAFDMSCLFLTAPLTLPIYDILIIGVLGYELYNGFTGNKSIVPYFPELTWESFTTPGKEKSSSPIPLPRTPLYILVLWVILLLIPLNIIELAFITFFLYALTDPTAAFNAASAFFPFVSQLPGI